MIINVTIDTEKDKEILEIINKATCLMVPAFSAAMQNQNVEEAQTPAPAKEEKPKAPAKAKAPAKSKATAKPKEEPKEDDSVDVDELLNEETPDAEVTATVNPQVRVAELRDKCTGRIKSLLQDKKKDTVLEIFDKLGIKKVTTATDAQIVSLADELDNLEK